MRELGMDSIMNGAESRRVAPPKRQNLACSLAGQHRFPGGGRGPMAWSALYAWRMFWLYIPEPGCLSLYLCQNEGWKGRWAKGINVYRPT